MAEEIRNLGTSTQLKTLGTHIKEATSQTTHTHTHTEALLRSQHLANKLFHALTVPTNILSLVRTPSHSISSSRSLNTCTEPRPRFQTTSSISLSRPRLIHLPSQSSHDSTMPLEVSQEIRTWLQRRGLGGYLHVIDAPAHPEAQEIMRQIHLDTVTNNIIRSALELQRGGEHDVEGPPHTILKDYFGFYSVSRKAYRTYGEPNKFFGEIARILMEYAFADTNPTSMPQKKAAIITKDYQGGTVDWGILTRKGV